MYVNSATRDLIKLVRSEVAPHYSKNDPGHGLNHAEDVCERALRLCYDYHMHIQPSIIVIAAYYHDIFATAHRPLHHQLASDYVRDIWSDSKPTVVHMLTKNEMELVCYAILEHRASFKGESYFSKLSELIACADRGIINVDVLLMRIWQVKKDKIADQDDLANDMLTHIKEKYGSNGYMRFPDLLLRSQHNLVNVRKDIDRLTLTKVKSLMSTYSDGPVKSKRRGKTK